MRRKFLQLIASIPVASVLRLKNMMAQEKLAININRLEKLKKVGGSVLLKIKGQPVLFVRENKEVVRGVDPTCTHQQCTVDYDEGKNIFICPCHGSRYDLEGNVLKGPAEKPLRNLYASLASERIIFTLGETNE